MAPSPPTIQQATQQLLAVVLVEPRIPQNFGNIARLCACTGIDLILIGDLGFSIDDKASKRSGMDYLENVALKHYADLPDVFADYPDWQPVFLSSHATQSHTQMGYAPKTLLVFGSEDKGLPKPLLAKYPDKSFRIPMLADRRSLNLSSSVAIVVYEGLRQLGVL